MLRSSKTRGDTQSGSAGHGMSERLQAAKWRSFEAAERVFEDSIATRYNRDYHEPPLMRSHSESFAKFVATFFKPGDRVLDLGCGPASLSPLWERELRDPATLVGIDLSPAMVAEAHRRFPTGDFRVGSFFDIPVPSGSFDIVVVSSALHHIPDESLPDAFREIHRVLDEHGVLVGREPLCTGRVVDQGPWMAGALMHLRHLAYRLTHTREYPEPSPTDAHHAYDAEQFLQLASSTLTVTSAEFRHPISPILARAQHPLVVRLATMLDATLKHRMGQELYYSARKNFSTAADVSQCVRLALEENRVSDVAEFLALVEASARLLERELGDVPRAERPIDPASLGDAGK